MIAKFTRLLERSGNPAKGGKLELFALSLTISLTPITRVGDRILLEKSLIFLNVIPDSIRDSGFYISLQD